MHQHSGLHPTGLDGIFGIPNGILDLDTKMLKVFLKV